MALFIACAISISLRYFIGLHKSRLLSSTAISFLGFICDSEKQVFLLPQGKRTKFAAVEKVFWVIRQSLWRTSKVRGENPLLCLLVPAAKLFTNSARQAISRGVKSVNDKLLISTELRDELPHGGFLGSWGRFLPWKSARHIHLILHSDASFCGWGGRLTPWASAANLSQWKKLRPSSTLLKVFCSIVIMPGLMPLSTTRSCCTAGNGKSRGPLQIQISWNPSSPSRWGGTSP